MLVTELPIVTLVRPVQSANATSPMVVTELGMVMLVRPVQSLNAQLPISVTELGMVTLVRLVQPENAFHPMVVTEEGIMVALQPSTSVLLAVSMIALQLSRESYFVLPAATLMLVRPMQPANAPLPMVVTELGMVMLVRPVQP